MQDSKTFCIGCFCENNKRQLNYYSLQCNSMREIFKTQHLLLCYLCKRVLQNAESFIQNVQNNQILLENFNNVMDDIPKMQVQSLVNLQKVSYDVLELSGKDGNNTEEGTFLVICDTNQDIDLKIEIKAETELMDSEDFIDGNDEFPDMYVKEEELTIDQLLKEELDIEHIGNLENENLDNMNLSVQQNCKNKDIPRIKMIYLTRKQCTEERLKMANDQKYIDSLYKCMNCIKGFPCKGSYDIHMEKHNQCVGEHECDICKIRMNSKEKLGNHMRYHEVVFFGTLEHMPEGQTLETAKHPKRARIVPAAVAKNSGSETVSSSLAMIAPSTSRLETPPPILAAPLSPHLPTPQQQTAAAEPSVLKIAMVPSPALYLECGADSGASTPKTTRPVISHVRSLSNIRRPLRDEQIFDLLNYGSEEESGEEEVEVTRTVVVPRVARMLMDVDEEDEGVEEGVNITFEWPHLPPRPSVCDPAPALPAPASPAPALPSPASPTLDIQSPMEPSDKFKFDWRAFTMPQIEPRLRREPFSQNVGPTVSYSNPYEAFTAIWDREIMEVIVRETNIYAQQITTTMLKGGTICPNSRITRWQDTNVNEVYTYLAIVLAMGVVIKNRLEEYWNTAKDIFSTPGFSTEMSFDRFFMLSKCIHFNNNRDCDPALLTRPQAKLFKIQPIIDHLNGKFSTLYNLSQNVALDESLTMWKGWLDINQFIRNKAVTVGIKTYEVCESQTGYLWRFEVHADHDGSAVQDDDPVSGIVPALVLRLLNGLEHKGHTIWMDNFYNSPALARELKVRGFDCVGTLRTNRQFVPSELSSLTKKDMTVGQVFGCTSGDVDIMVWRDKNRVAFVSTYHGLATTRCGDTLKPTVVQDYSICMGGVDSKDQRLSMYPIERRRTRVWYKKFFRKLLNASVLNSYILLNKNQVLTHRKFRKALITDLLAACKTPTPNAATITIASVHSPAQYDLIKPGKSDRLKRQCAVCKKRTVTYCKACNVPMCIFTCYEPYHTLY